jgi:hypothetical protein
VGCNMRIVTIAVPGTGPGECGDAIGSASIPEKALLGSACGFARRMGAGRPSHTGAAE